VNDVLVETADAIGFIRLNRPHRANSVTPEVVTALGDAVRELGETESIRALVLTGTGSVFCAGADVQEMHLVYRSKGADGLMDYLTEVWMPAVQQTVRVIWAAPKPIVAAFNGAATAGGLDFGLACDVRVAATTARFAESYINLGMIPVAGGVLLLPLVAGLSAATELLASGQVIGADRAHALRLVDYVCQPEALEARARELAAKLAHGPAASFACLKQILRQAAAPNLDAALRASYEANVALIARDDVRSRIVAVMEQFTDQRERP
jgi:2-(1,2-epoxy-1,2-dihydrophenyl)acetyl-CoA isomerase